MPKLSQFWRNRLKEPATQVTPTQTGSAADATHAARTYSAPAAITAADPAALTSNDPAAATVAALSQDSAAVIVETTTVDASAGGTAQTANCSLVPAHSILLGVYVEVVTPFDGDATQTLEVGVGGNIDDYIDTVDFDPSAAAGTNYANLNGANNDMKYPEWIDAETQIIATWTNTASASAGEVKVICIYVCFDSVDLDTQFDAIIADAANLRTELTALRADVAAVRTQFLADLDDLIAVRTALTQVGADQDDTYRFVNSVVDALQDADFLG